MYKTNKHKRSPRCDSESRAWSRDAIKVKLLRRASETSGNLCVFNQKLAFFFGNPHLSPSPTCSQVQQNHFFIPEPVFASLLQVCLFAVHSWALALIYMLREKKTLFLHRPHHSNLLCAYVAVDHSHHNQNNRRRWMWNTWAIKGAQECGEAKKRD